MRNKPNIPHFVTSADWPALSAIVTGLLVAGLLLHWSRSTGLWCDELLFLRAVELGPWRGLMAIGSSHPPLLRWLMAPWADGTLPDWMLRLPSVLAAVANVWVWKAFLTRLLPDRWTVALLLPTLALNVAWLAIAYQCVPYALFTLLASLHALAWLTWIERPDQVRWGWLVVSGGLCAWTHFYGLNVLVADQIVWLLLCLGRQASRRQWLAATALSGLMVLPLAPVLMHYLDVERQVTILRITDYGSYFWNYSAEIFARTTFFGLRIAAPVWLGWWLLAALLLRGAWRRTSPNEGTENPPAGDSSDHADPRPRSADTPHRASLATPVTPWHQAAVVCGLFLAGLPAAQAHSILSGEAMWERYTMAGMWLHWPLVALWMRGTWGVRWTRGLALATTLTGLLVLRLGPEASPLFTNDYRPVVAHLRRDARAGDAFLAQDMDIWTGERNFERLWFRRYGKLPLRLVSGSAKRRITLYQQGLPLDEIPSDVNRVWVHSLLFNADWYRRNPVPGWRIGQLAVHGDNYPLVLYVREDAPVKRQPAGETAASETEAGETASSEPSFSAPRPRDAVREKAPDAGSDSARLDDDPRAWSGREGCAAVV